MTIGTQTWMAQNLNYAYTGVPYNYTYTDGATFESDSTSGWYSNGNGTDAYGFSALPAGYRDLNGCFYGVGDTAYFRSASQYESRSYDAKSRGYSIRCIKN